ncbi:hypothetical protein ACQR16_35045 [Bradyrhizobium oligotrophicum]|uniref:hypothetical protein n=1 Tax=Bradyrhizobium oligotrophicum TaxID=44255 RepID=UPI003EB79643
MNDKRPKSREETPKEGSDNAKALPHRNNMQMRCTKSKGFSADLHAKNTGRVAASATQTRFFIRYVNDLIEKSDQTGGAGDFALGFG